MTWDKWWCQTRFDRRLAKNSKKRNTRHQTGHLFILSSCWLGTLWPQKLSHTHTTVAFRDARSRIGTWSDQKQQLLLCDGSRPVVISNRWQAKSDWVDLSVSLFHSQHLITNRLFVTLFCLTSRSWHTESRILALRAAWLYPKPVRSKCHEPFSITMQVLGPKGYVSHRVRSAEDVDVMKMQLLRLITTSCVFRCRCCAVPITTRIMIYLFLLCRQHTCLAGCRTIQFKDL